MLVFHALNTLWRLLNNKERIYIWSLSFGLALIGIVEMLTLFLLFTYLRLVTNPNDNQYIPFIGNIYGIIDPYDNTFLIIAGLSLVFLFLVKNLLVISIDILYRRFVFFKKFNIVNQLYKSFLNLPYEHIKSMAYDSIQNTISSVEISFKKSLLSTLQIISSCIIILMLAILLALVNFSLTIALSGFFAVIIFALNTKNRSALNTSIKNRNTSQEETDNIIYETSKGFLDIHLNNAKQEFSKRFQKANDDNINADLRIGTLWQLPYMFNEVLLSTAIITSIIYFIMFEKNINNIIPTLAIFALAGIKLSRLLSKTAQSFQNISESRLELKEMKSIVSQLKYHSSKSTNKQIISITNEINVQSIQYHYPNQEKLLLEDISMTIRKGQFIGICGISGSGKSTLALLLCGLLKPHQGGIFYDNNNSIHDDVEGWQNQIGLVQSIPYISPTSIRNNITFGCNKEEINDGLVWHVLELAKLDDFIKQLPSKLDTDLLAVGSELSDGQKQRIAMARCLYRNPQVIILDEATSSLDKKTETKLMSNILGLDKTVICISHKASTIRNADQIYVIKTGKVVAKGDYQSLKKDNIL